MEGRKVFYLNLPIKEVKELTLKQLRDKEAVWFGCDMGKNLDRESGYMHDDLYFYNEALASCIDLDKGKRLDYCDGKMTHAMIFSGVNIIDEEVNRWKVENSWGKEVGENGIFVMSDSWFDEHVYQVVINKKHLSEEQKKELLGKRGMEQFNKKYNFICYLE